MSKHDIPYEWFRADKMVPSSPNWEPCLEHAALSDVGLRRANNQDAMAVVLAASPEVWRQRGHLFTVADGMGAHAAGELASKMAADAVPLTYSKRMDVPPPEAILTAIREANQQIHGRGEAAREFQGMGTTSTTLLLLPQGALLGHVGDSRGYRLRGNRLEQLTFDHSLVWEMRAAGHIPEDVTPDFIPKNIITRSLGPAEDVQVDLEGPFPVVVGDTFLLCSDGLSGLVEDAEMGTILASMPPAEAVQALVDLANLRGGPDNITVIVVRVTAPLEGRGDQSERDASAKRVAARAAHPLILTLLGVLILAALAAAALQHWLLALVFLGGTLAAVAASIVLRRGETAAGSDFDGGRLGKGPYTSTTCMAGEELIDQLSEIVHELRDSAIREDWTVDWPRLNALLGQGMAAREAGDRARAVREYCQAISFMMAQLKGQHDAGGGSNLSG